MWVAHPAELVERARLLVTTTDRPLTEIAAELDIGVKTLGTWKRENGWVRPPGAKWLKIPRSKYAALQRLYENRATLADIAIVAGCSVPWITKTAAFEKWTSRRESAASRRGTARALSAAIAEIQAGLRDPGLGRRDLIRLIERATVLAAADALGGDRESERNAHTLTRLAALVRNLPEEAAAPPAQKDTHAPDPVDDFPDANDLIEEIARRFEEFCAAEDAAALSQDAAAPPA
jgi:hypothetical protein